MSQNVSQVVQNVSKSLHDKLNSNIQIANLVMALIGKLVIMSNQQGKPIEGITFTSPTWMGSRTLTSQITFSSLSLVGSMGVWQGDSDLLKYAMSRSSHMARALEKNPNMTKFFTDMLMRLESFSTNKRIPFDDLKFEKAFIDKTNRLVVKLDKEGLSIWDR